MTTTKQQVSDLIRDVFPEDRAEEILGDEAFGALVWRVREHCKIHGTDPEYAFELLDEDDMEFAVEGADNPAAYLAAKIRDL